MRKTLALMLPFIALSAAPGPALAQDAGERVNQLIIYGDDACPVSGEEIVICARKDEAERYRVPEILRGNPDSPRNEPWTDRVQAYEMVGAAGIQSCSPVGPGGATGCLSQIIEAAYAQREGGTDVRFGQLIAEERAKRLSTIDADAAETQARVERLEKEYEAKLAAERGAADPPGAGELPRPPGG